MEYRFSFRLGWLLILFILSGSGSSMGAEGSRARTEVISLLEDSLSQARFRADSARRALANAVAELDLLKDQNHKLRDENRRMVFRLQDTERKAQHLEQTNSMFVLYTGVAAVLFLFTLLFIVVRKLSAKPKPMPGAKQDQDVDRRIERLTALGNLRERGLLTDQEVEEQKRFLL